MVLMAEGRLRQRSVVKRGHLPPSLWVRPKTGPDDSGCVVDQQKSSRVDHVGRIFDGFCHFVCVDNLVCI